MPPFIIKGWESLVKYVPAIVTGGSLLVSGIIWGIRQEGRESELEHRVFVLDQTVRNVDEHGTRQLPLLLERENQIDARITDFHRQAESSNKMISDLALDLDRLKERQQNVLMALDEYHKQTTRLIEQIDRLDTPLSKIVEGQRNEIMQLKDRLNGGTATFQELDRHILEITRRINDLDPVVRRIIELESHVKILDQKGDYILDMLRKSNHDWSPSQAYPWPIPRPSE